MKKFNSILFLSLLAITVFIMPGLAVAGESSKEVASEFLEVMRFEKVMNDAIDASVQMVIQMNPEIAKHETQLRKFYDKYMSAKSLREDVITIYMETFSEKELKEIMAFYKTETGQKTLDKLPELVQRSMQIAQTRVMENMFELQKMLES